MNGNIYNHSLALEQYSWNGGSAYAIPPNPPASTSTITGEPLLAQSYINAYNTAFNQPYNYQLVLYNYHPFSPYSPYINSNFVNGTFRFQEEYIVNPQSILTINPLKNILSAYNGMPYLFVSAGSGGGSGFMYLNWIIVTYGVPYVISVP
jgi:hypothetical protein